MHPTSPRQIHLPTEVILLIVSLAATNADNDAQRQRTMHTCCLVSRQWYSAAVAFLYEKPRLDRGRAFYKFTDTISPPVAARKSKMNLGSMVRKLDLSCLVHHSKNSLTARLLGKVKENLEVFIAPSVTFAVNCLPALSKCHNLRHLDLSLVGEPLPFANLKKALSSLTKLLTLRLPRSTSLDEFQAQASQLASWPLRLYRLQFSGSFSATAIPSFAWPPSLTSLTLKNCSDLSVNNLGSLISNPNLATSLSRLTISGSNRNLSPESINAIPAFLPGLNFLSIPGDLVQESFFDMLNYMVPPLALEVLEFGNPFFEATLGFSTAALVESFATGLGNLRAVGFADTFLTEQRILEDEEIDNVLQRRIREKSKPALQAANGDGVVDDYDNDDDDPDVGVYYL
ncbi:hypothetical protein SI65_05601 [Aspergillus cristatus]|uniref:Uncharacterized protein n=1 Tax=Aspergillus cristatus TaxID=573508 RepID=A0A1E3BDF7_ASPCR|nr:hypothetical protein SI65_05601 [Aspergillus cristatus]